MQGKEMLRKLLREFTIRLGVPLSRTATQNLCWRDEYALADLQNILDRLKIQSVGIHIDASDLPNVNCPAIAAVKGVPGGFAILTEIQTESARLSYWADGEGEKNVSFHEFSEIWDGKILLAEAGETSGDAEYGFHRRQENLEFTAKTFAVTAFVFLTVMGGYRLAVNGDSITAAFFLLKTVGLLVALLLVRVQLFGEDYFTQKLCGIAGKTSCKNVLTSRIGKLFGVFLLSELTLIYYAGGFFAFMLSAFAQNTVTGMLSALSLLVFPAVPISLYIQWRVNKQWCPLCLGVNAVLLSEVICSYFVFNNGSGFEGLILVFFAFLLCALLWAVFKKPFESYANQAFLETAFKRFKQEPSLFLARIEKEEPISGCPVGLLLGSMDSPVRVTAVLSPDCPPCAHAFFELEKLLDVFEGTLSVNIVFAAGHSEKHVSFRKHILGMLGQEGEEVLQKALSDWFHIMDYGLWAKKYPSSDSAEGLEALAEHRRFTRNIRQTPVIFINGRPLPPPYLLSDIKYFVRALAESHLLAPEEHFA